VLINMTLLLNRPETIGWQAYYNTGLLVLMWAVLLWQLWRERQPVSADAHTD
jgi:hypothetical protein